MKPLGMPFLARLIELLDLKETELLKAIISGFTPFQPGALNGTWKKRAGYAPPESAKVVWELFEEADFKSRQDKILQRRTKETVEALWKRRLTNKKRS